MEPLFAEAMNSWKLSELYADLASIKGHALTDWEKTCLRGLLCRHSPKYIAQQIYWTVNALRTELSRKLYRYIEELIQDRIFYTKVSWNNIADSLDKLGYKQAFNVPSDFVLSMRIESSASILVVPISKVIASITSLSYVSKQLPTGDNLLEDLKITNLVNKLIEEGDFNLQQQKYNQALQCYYQILAISTSLDINTLVNIAMCYDRLDLHGDSLALCYFILSFLPSPTDNCLVGIASQDENRYKIHTFIGDIFRTLAVEKSDSTFFNTAIKHYDLAVDYNSLNIAPLRQQLDLILAAIGDRNILEIDRQRYVDLARKKINKLLEFSSEKDPEQIKINEQTLLKCQSIAR
jgi:tetratricopeptide (TPR) repeat protein